MNDPLERCFLCPRMCGARRSKNEKGWCGAGALPKVARAALHYWEEPCISGETGSGTVFFSGCTLRCRFCQNRAISRGEAGVEVSLSRLADIFLELQEQGALNINLVTPMHYAPQIMTALDDARARGLSLPIVWNTGGWERAESVALVKDYADVWLTDMKYADDGLARRFSGAPDYFEQATAALDEMVRETGGPVFDGRGTMTKGVIVRHLMLPGHGDDTRAVLKYLRERYGDRVWVSIMNQYTPMGEDALFPELSRPVTDAEYEAALEYAMDIGIENAFIQEGGAVSESFIPGFDLTGV